MQTVVKKLHEELQVLKDDKTAAEEALERAIGYVQQGGKEIRGGMKTNDML